MDKKLKHVDRYNAILEFLGEGKTSSQISEAFGLSKNMTSSMMYTLFNMDYVSAVPLKGASNPPSFLYTALKEEIEDKHIYIGRGKAFEENNQSFEITAIEKNYPKLSSLPQKIYDLVLKGVIHKEVAPQRHPLDKRSSPKVYVGCSFEII